MAPSLAQSLPFVHPELAGYALLATVIPVLIHLINRRRHRRVPWAAMQFLLAASKRSLRRLRMEQWLLLALRMALVGLVGLAIARPFLPATAFVPLGEVRTHRVLILDDSLSMNAKRPDGRTRFDAAKVAALELLASFPPADAVSVVTMAAPASAPIDHASFDRRFARERVIALDATQRLGDTVSAIDLAVSILRSSELPESNRSAYVISDFPAREWDSPASDQSGATAALRRLVDALPVAADLAVLRVADGPAVNVAVTQLEAGPAPAVVGSAAPVAIRLRNFGATAQSGLTLQVRRDGAVLRRETVPRLEPGAEATVAVQVPFATPGTHTLEARSLARADDLLEWDDARYLSIEVRDRIPVLIVEGRLGTFLERESSFLATALAPGMESPGAAAAASGPFEPRVVSALELPSEALASFQAVALCGVGAMGPDAEAAFESFVRDGGGLVIFAGDEFAAPKAAPAGTRLLPGTLGEVADMTGAGGTRFVIDNPSHPIIAEFATEPRSGLFGARVDRYSRFTPDVSRCETAMKFSTGDPALVTANAGDGVVAFVATSANLSWNNLAARGDYVSLTHHLFGHVIARQGRQRNLLVGQTLRERLAPEQASMVLRVAGSEGSNEEPVVVSEGGTMRAEFGPIERAGILTLGIGAESRAFAVNVDTSESDLSATDASRLRAALDRDVRLVSVEDATAMSHESSRATEISPTLLFLALGALMVESLFATRFGHPRA